MPRYEVKLLVESYVVVEVDADSTEQAIDAAREIADLRDAENTCFTGEGLAKKLPELEFSPYACLTCLGTREFGMRRCSDCRGTGREAIKK